ncbi:MAG: hypothetical protein ACI840_000169 [Ulvibacter sp.]
MLYAIGEIILVVIGILIALSINNQNEIRKERAQETVILKQLLGDFNSNLRATRSKNFFQKRFYEFISAALKGKHAGIEDIGNGIWKVFYRDVFLGFFNETQLRNKQKSIRLETNLV